MIAKFIIGIDLGGTNLKVALLDSKYKIINKEVLSTRRFFRKENLILAVIGSVKKIIGNNKLTQPDILGLGLGLPGPIDAQRGIVHFFPNIPGWKEVKLERILRKKLRLPVFLDNDANLMALAEHRLGAAKGLRNAVCLTLGTGVGGGIIIEGNLYRGRNNASAEIGHVPINEKGPKCNCGGIACLETYIGNKRILKQARRLFKRDISLEELSDLAKKHNKQAQALWSKVAEHLAVALVGVVNLLNPEGIVIGGGMANAGKILFDQVRQVISRQAMAVQSHNLKIFKAKLGSDAGLIGAAIMVKEGIRL
jgi:glucokinase